MSVFFFRLGCLLAGLAVGFGAFGAHGLRTRVTPELLAVFETGARYQMYHALTIVAIGLALDRWPASAAALGAAGWLFAAGILLFSGSLYALTLTGTRWWGAVTPLGGLAFLAGWLVLVLVVRPR